MIKDIMSLSLECNDCSKHCKINVNNMNMIWVKC